MNQFTRSEWLLGKEAIEKLHKCHVALFGVGGVGGAAMEALARAGIGAIDLIDNDVVSLTNLNRQLVATHETIGKKKVDVGEKRILSIYPECKVKKFPLFYLPGETQIDFSQYDYVIDAIDTVKAKLDLIKKCQEAGVPVISALGCGNRLDPSKLLVTDLFKTENDPLAKVMRREARALGIKKLKVVCSKELPLKPNKEEEEGKISSPGSSPFVPPVAGYLLASEVIKDLLERNDGE